MIHEVPGIVYSPLERRARIQGKGLEVWEVMNIYRSVDYNWDDLQVAIHWLTSEQLRAALKLAELNAEFVNAEIAENDAFDFEEFWRQNPRTRPKS
jgi:hypothetical protein